MEPLPQPGPQPIQAEPQPQHSPIEPQSKEPKADRSRALSLATSAPSPGRRAILFGALLIGTVVIGAFSSGLLKIPGADQMSAPTAVQTQTKPVSVDETNKVHWIGVQIQDLTPVLAKSLGSSRAEGVAIRTVRPNSPADQAGMRADDIIIAMDDVPLGHSAQIASKIQLTTVGDAISVTFERGGTMQTTMVRVGLANRCTQPGNPVCSY